MRLRLTLIKVEAITRINFNLAHILRTIEIINVESSRCVGVRIFVAHR